MWYLKCALYVYMDTKMLWLRHKSVLEILNAEQLQGNDSMTSTESGRHELANLSHLSPLPCENFPCGMADGHIRTIIFSSRALMAIFLSQNLFIDKPLIDSHTPLLSKYTPAPYISIPLGAPPPPPSQCAAIWFTSTRAVGGSPGWYPLQCYYWLL